MRAVIFLSVFLALITATAWASGGGELPAASEGLAGLPKNSDGYAEVTASQLRSVMEGGEDFLLVNVNAAAKDVIPETDFIMKTADISKNLEMFPDKNQPVVVYCEGGMMSRPAAAKLAEEGYSDVIWLKGGHGAWRNAGYDSLTR